MAIGARDDAAGKSGPTFEPQGGGTIAGTVSVAGPLTNAQLRASALAVTFSAATVSVSNFPASQAVTGTFWPATQPVSGTFWPATQPVSIAASVAVTGPVTDTQLRASALPVSGTFWQTTQPVSLASLPALAAGSAAIGSVTVSNFPASQAVTGTFWPATQPVSIASMPTTAVTGTFFQATQPVSIAATVAVSGPATDAQLRASALPVSLATLPALVAGSAVIGAVTQSGTWTVTQPAITKGTQGTNGVTTQDLKDAGRAIVNAATAIAGVACVATEALLSLNVSRDGGTVAATTSIAVTAGKRLRITALVCSARSTAAAVLSARVSLRMNPSAAVTATSPIIAIASMTQQAAALAEAGDTCVIPFPDGIEFSGTMQIGLTQVCNVATGVIYASLIGYEY